MGSMSPMGSLDKRRLGDSDGLRLFLDQQAWLERMRTERAADTKAILRAALDFYMPIYEATHQGIDPSVLAQVAEAVRLMGKEHFLALLASTTSGLASVPAEIPAEIRDKLAAGAVRSA